MKPTVQRNVTVACEAWAGEVWWPFAAVCTGQRLHATRSGVKSAELDRAVVPESIPPSIVQGCSAVEVGLGMGALRAGVQVASRRTPVDLEPAALRMLARVKQAAI